MGREDGLGGSSGSCSKEATKATKREARANSEIQRHLLKLLTDGCPETTRDAVPSVHCCSAVAYQHYQKTPEPNSPGLLIAFVTHDGEDIYGRLESWGDSCPVQYEGQDSYAGLSEQRKHNSQGISKPVDAPPGELCCDKLATGSDMSCGCVSREFCRCDGS